MAATPPNHPYLGLVAFLIVCLAAAGIGEAVTRLKIGTWYATLVKPSWNPLNWIFGPVWSVLYFCTGRHGNGSSGGKAGFPVPRCH